MKKDTNKSSNAAKCRRLAKERRKSKPPLSRASGMPGKSGHAAESLEAMMPDYRTLVENLPGKVLFDNLSDGIVFADPENKKFFVANQAFCRMFWDRTTALFL